jgi:hypothetical protein
MAYVSESEWVTKLIWNYYKYNQETDSTSLFTDNDWYFIENDSEELIYNPWVPETPKDCEPQTTEEWYKLSNWILHRTPITLTKSWNEIEHWIIILEQDYQCNKSKLEKVWEERIIINCTNEEDQEYIPNNNTCVASV